MQIHLHWQQQFRSSRSIGKVYSQITIEDKECDHMQH